MIQVAEDDSMLHQQRDQLWQALMARGEDAPNRDLFASMLSSWKLGIADLPSCLGLDPSRFEQLLQSRFPGFNPLIFADVGNTADPQRLPERQELLDLLLRYRAGNDDSELWMADILVAACMGGNHLWQDLGLWSRTQLSALMRDNFPMLADLNNRDMKWKKFLYKQLCKEEGIYVCRSPSCEVCSDYSNCFGPEQ